MARKEVVYRFIPAGDSRSQLDSSCTGPRALGLVPGGAQRARQERRSADHLLLRGAPARVYFVLAYAKNVQENITADQQKILRELAKALDVEA